MLSKKNEQSVSLTLLTPISLNKTHDVSIVGQDTQEASAV